MIRKSVFLTLILLLAFGCTRSASNINSNIYINEILPDNGHFGNLKGSTPDWIELYNPNAFAVDLGGYYLGDDRNKPLSWKIPQGVMIQGKGYLRIWTGDDARDRLSASFGLNQDVGEDVVLTAPDSITMIDSVSFPPLSRDISWAKVFDDAGNYHWTSTANVTPEEPNKLGGIHIQLLNVTPAYPYSPVTFKVRAVGKGSSDAVLLHYNLTGDDADWRSVSMTLSNQKNNIYSYTVSGEGLLRGDTIRFYTTTYTEDGLLVSDPPEINAEGDNPYRMQVGSRGLPYGTLAITEIMPWNQTYSVRKNSAGTPGWIEIYNRGRRSVNLANITIREVISGAEYPSTLQQNLSPGDRTLFFANAADSGEELNFRLSSSVGTIVINSKVNGNEIARLAYNLSGGDVSFGYLDDKVFDPGYELPYGTPREPNPAGNDGIFFSGESPVWVNYNGDQVVVEDGKVAVFALVSWKDAWKKERVPPDVIIHWKKGGPGDVNDEFAELDMEETPLRNAFVGRIPIQSGGETIIRYMVEARDGRGHSFWHSNLGVTAGMPNPEYAHAFSVGGKPSDIIITEVGLIPETYDAKGIYDEYEAPDSSGLVKRRRTYVELYNGGDEAFSLAGKFLSFFDRSETVARGSRYFSEEWKLSGGVIEPGQYYAIELDGGNLDAPSLLQQFAGSTVSLYDSLENGNKVLDRFVFDPLSVWESTGAFGRSLDSEEGVKLQPSPGEENILPVFPDLMVNEIYWSGEAKWIELYNGGAEAIDIDKLDLHVGLQGRGWSKDDALDLAETVSLLPHDYVVIVFQGEDVIGIQSDLDLTGVPTDPDFITITALTDNWIWSEDTRTLDEINDPVFNTGFSNGRVPDGGTAWFEVLEPTPGESNMQPLFINEIFPDVSGGFIELFNSSSKLIDVSDYILAIAGTDLVLESGSVIAPGGFLAFDIHDLPVSGEVNLLQPGGGGGMVDTAGWSDIPGGSSWGRLPDGGTDFTLCSPTPAALNLPPGDLFIRGDCNGDGVVDLSAQETNSDLAVLIAFLDGSNPVLTCEDRCDLNDDGRVSTADIIYFVKFVINNDPPDIPPPFPQAGIDPTADSLKCEL